MNHDPFTWRGIEFRWIDPAQFYTGDTALGRWVLYEHRCGKWSVAFRGCRYGEWESDRVVALERARLIALAQSKEELMYLQGMPS